MSGSFNVKLSIFDTIILGLFSSKNNTSLAERNITDPVAQKEYVKKTLGRDILGLAHKKYEARSDHKKLVESFLAIDVNQSTATILENNSTYESVAHEISDLAKRIFVNGHLCHLSNLPKIEAHVYDSIDIMRTAQDHPTFIFNLSMVNHTLGDIQQIAHAILSGTHPVMQRSSELLTRGLGTFFKNLNPITQASNMGHLASDLGSLLKKGCSALWNDPINVIHNGMNSTCTLIDLIRNTADFTSDLTVGRLYLSPEEYKQRTDAFCAMMEPLQGVTGDQCAVFIGQLAADIFFLKGLGNTYTFINKLSNLTEGGLVLSEKYAAEVAGFGKLIIEEGPEVTAKISNVIKSDLVSCMEGENAANQVRNKIKSGTDLIRKGAKDIPKSGDHIMPPSGGSKEIINSNKALLESAYAPVARNLKNEIDAIKSTATAPHGFAEFAHKPIKIAHEHILGMEIELTKKGNLDIKGFHHDFKCTMEKSNILKFTNKTFNEHGYYTAELVMDSLPQTRKSFFPSDWSQNEVISKICEAYENFLNSGIAPLEKGGKYIIDGITNEGVTIRMFITKNGQMTTAYPML